MNFDLLSGKGFAAMLFDMDGTILNSIAAAEKVWASITGKPPARAAAPAPLIAATSPAAGEPASFARVEIVGPVDTPEELSEAFRRIDEVRQGRLNARSERIDQRIGQLQ